MAREYNIEEIEFEKNEIPKEKLLTGEYLKGISPHQNIQPNAEVEEGEYLQFPDQEVTKALGNEHKGGGVKVAIPDGTKILSDHLKPTKKQIRQIEKSFNINVSESDTFAKVVEKYTKKIGLAKLTDDQEKVFSQLEKMTRNKDIPKATADVNLEYLSSKIKKIEEAKKPLESERKNFFDYVFQLQEATKKPEERADQFRFGGTFEQTAMKFGMTPQEAEAYLKKGGFFTSDRFPMFEDGGIKTAENLTEEERKEIKEKWDGKTEAYIDFKNSAQAIESNDELLSDIYEQYKKSVESEDYYTGSKSETKKKFKEKYGKDLSQLNKEDVLKELLAFEERNARLAAHGLDPSTVGQNAAPNSPISEKTKKFIEDNPSLKDLDFSKGYRGQAAYIAYYNTLKNNDKYKGLAEFQEGVGDETIAGTKGKVSGIDNFNTNTTLGQRLKYKWQQTPTPTTPNTPEPTDLTPKTEKEKEKTKPGEQKEVVDNIKVPPQPRGPRYFYTPDQSPLPPTALDPVALFDARTTPIDPVRIGIETQLREANEQQRFIANTLEGMPETQKAAVLANMMATSQKQINQTATQANQINAQNVASAELYNAQQKDRESLMRANNLMSYEQRTLLGKAKTEEMLRRYYDQLKKVNIDNFKNTQKLNLLDSVFPEYSLDTFGMSVNFDPDNPNKEILRDSFLKMYPLLGNG